MSRSEQKKSVCIGIPCYAGVSHETLGDYMRFAYHLGRRYQDYEFFLAIKGKSEQFRARNAIVEAALSHDCDYLLMLDDDHVIDIDNSLSSTERYEFLRKLIDHLEEDPKKGIVGALYYQRGADCSPVMMFKNGSAYSFYTHQEISRCLQKVDVAGGGCMVLNMKVFDKIPSPWFEAELGMGTDVQICKKVSDAGYSVWVDTSIEIGHLKTDRMVITSQTAQQERMKASEWMNRPDIQSAPMLQKNKAERTYMEDVLEYTGRSEDTLFELASTYDNRNHKCFDQNNIESYYRRLGLDQIARNYYYHRRDRVVQEGEFILRQFNQGVTAYGLDYGCGTSPIGFELALRGHHVDFIDVPRSEADKFVRWRAEKHDIEAGFELAGPYDWVLLLDVIEHFRIDEAEPILADIVKRMKPKGSIVTNYFHNRDHENHEHINMNKEETREIFNKLGLVMMPIVMGPTIIQDFRWIKTSEAP